VEQVVLLEPPSRLRRSAIEQVTDTVKRARPRFYRTVTKLLKAFTNGSCHLYFTNRTLTVRSLGSEFRLTVDQVRIVVLRHS